MRIRNGHHPKGTDLGPAAHFGYFSMRPTVGHLGTMADGETWMTMNKRASARKYFGARERKPRAPSAPPPAVSLTCEVCGEAYKTTKPTLSTSCSDRCRKRRWRRANYRPASQAA